LSCSVAIIEHLRHVLGGARLVRGRLDADRADVLAHRGDHLVGELADRDAALDRALDDLVLDVRDVADIRDLVAEHLQPAIDDVERHHHAGMAHVAQVIDRHAAHVHAHLARNDRNEFFGLAGESVEETQRHRQEQEPAVDFGEAGRRTGMERGNGVDAGKCALRRSNGRVRGV
jgi:hypothetical protein